MDYIIGSAATLVAIILIAVLLVRRWDKETEVEPKPKKVPYVNVIAVHNVPKQKVKVHHYSSFGSSQGYTEAQMTQTIVLYTDLRGVLKTKTFKGKWTLEEVKNWLVEKED